MTLFDPDYPKGFYYQRGFISAAEEAALLEQIQQVTFENFELRGVIARRRVAFFGEAYDRTAAGSIPDFLFPLRSSVAKWAELDPEAFAMVLINEYRPGSPIGWHRDAPQYGIVAGVSLLTRCRMKFRPYVRPSDQAKLSTVRRATHEVWLEPRSVYLIKDEARSAFEHHIPPVESLRYSITFRTLRSAKPALT